MKPMYIKLALAVVLFVAWVLLVAFKVQGAGDLIAFIKTALEGLGLYHAVTLGNGASSASTGVLGEYVAPAQLTPAAANNASPITTQPPQ